VNIFFDVDDTLIASRDGSLRPLAREVLKMLNDDGDSVYVWSGTGLRWAEIKEHDLGPYVRDCYIKPLVDHRNALISLGIVVEPDFVVDDYRDVVEVFGGHAIRPYVVADLGDRELTVVYEKIKAARRARASSGQPR